MLQKTDGETAFAYYKLRLMRGMLSKQQISTFKGQIKSGNAVSALAGMENIYNNRKSRYKDAFGGVECGEAKKGNRPKTV